MCNEDYLIAKKNVSEILSFTSQDIFIPHLMDDISYICIIGFERCSGAKGNPAGEGWSKRHHNVCPLSMVKDSVWQKPTPKQLKSATF